MNGITSEHPWLKKQPVKAFFSLNQNAHPEKVLNSYMIHWTPEMCTVPAHWTSR